MHWWLHPRDKPGLLWAVLEQVQGLGARLSLEGYLGRTRLLTRPDADPNETTVLKRQGEAVPPMDFIVLPVNAGLVHQLKVELKAQGTFGPGGWLHHAQVDVGGALAFGGYDNFHKDCVMASSPLTEAFFDHLVRSGVLVSYERKT